MHFVPWKPRETVDDAALVRRIAEGDAAALDAAYRREADAVFRFAQALCGNPAWAADAVQEAFVALTSRPEGFDASRGSLGAWLAGVARHALLAQWRRATSEVTEGEAGGEVDDTALPPEALLVGRQSREALWDAVHALPWPMREALVLVDLQDRPYAEAAAIAGIELNTLRTRLHRARAKLAAALGAGEEGSA